MVDGQRERAVQKVDSLIAEGRWLEARGAVRAFWSSFGRDLSPGESKQWRRMDFRISEESGDLARLVWLQQQSPDIAREMESVCLLLVRTFAAAGQPEEAVKLREDWRGREAQPHLWMALDVDLLLAQGEHEEALALLRSQKFPGTSDVGRLLRLSFLNPKPDGAWAELTVAWRADPTNPDVRSFRAQLLERAGAVQDARIEYVAALVANPEDPVRRDQLAEFYRRHGSNAAALQTWRDGLAPTAPDFLWLRVLFWQRLWQGTGSALPEASLGNWTALIGGLTKLSHDRFWHDGLMSPAELRLASGRPEVEWLQLLELIRAGETKEAQLHLERFSDTAEALAPVAWATIRSVLRWQLRELAPQYGEMPVAVSGTQAHALIDELRAWPGEGLSEETKRLLSGTRAWPALMLALGWSEAALKMVDGTELSQDPSLPSWVHYGFAVALRQNRDAKAALAYLSNAPKVPYLELLTAEMKWSAGASAADSGLAALAKGEGAVGYRAAWLLALQALELGEWSQARDWINGQSELRQSLSGREMVARAALMSGDEAGAGRLYEGLGLESLEAGMFLARRAFAEGRWQDAHDITEQLLARFPGELELRGNLEKIAQAEAAAETGGR